MTASPVRTVSDGVTVAVRLTSKAAQDRVDGVAPGRDGGRVLRARVTAAPAGGMANAALIRLLSKAWKLPKSTLSIAAGAKDRHKVVHVAGDPAALGPSLARWIEAHLG